MAKQLDQIYDSPDVYTYTTVQRNENMYELGEIYKREAMKSEESLLSTPGLTAAPNVSMEPKQRQSSWSKPLLFMTVLLCLILILLIIILGIVVYDKYATGNNVECTNTATGASSSSNTNEWADRIAGNVSQKIPDFNEWADRIAEKVFQELNCKSLNFSEGTDHVINTINETIMQSLPDFNEWANGVVSKVNSNVTGSLPDFNEWANGVVSKVNSNVTGSLPDFNEWANGVVSVNSNVTGSLPDFNEWANGVVSKVNSNVTGSLPDFNEWANGISQNTLQLFQNNTNFTELDKQILQTTRDSAQKLINIVNTLSNLQDTSTSTAGVVNGVLLIAQELLVLHNDSTALPTSIAQELLVLHNDSTALPTSCKHLQEQQPNRPSGYYILASTNGSTNYTAYCNMGTLCGSGGGWTRLAYLNMSDATQNCPSGFRLYQSGGVRSCGRPVTSSASCVSVQFPSNGINYTQICGRVTGYQFGSNDALYTGNGNNHNNLNADYVDGVSLTRGSPRQHVWTFMGGVYESVNVASNCPCTAGSPQINIIPDFIGNNYFCESGNPTSTYHNQFFTSDPLWDGKLCRSLETACCNVTGIPWFHRDYGSNTTTDYIELRVCEDEGTDNEDTPFGLAEIYVK